MSASWKNLEKLTIVVKNHEHHFVEYAGKKYPKAYIVEAGNKKQLESAMSWARSYAAKDPKVFDIDNGDFTIQLAEAANGSWHGGKLSFWMCIISKDGMDPIAVGINADMLLDLMLQSTFVNGKCSEKVLFARKNGSLGVLHTKMTQFEELNKSIAYRKNIGKGKTKKWNIGQVYSTLTQSDVYFGKFKTPLRVNKTYMDNLHGIGNPYCVCSYYDTVKIDRHVYGSPIYNEDGTSDFVQSVAKSFCGYQAFKDSVPARQCSGQLFANTDDIYDRYIDAITKFVMANDYFVDYSFTNIPEIAFALIEHNKDMTIKLLETVKSRLIEYIDLADSVDRSTHKHYVYKKSCEQVFVSIFKNGEKTLDKTLLTLPEYYDKLIELAKSVDVK